MIKTSTSRHMYIQSWGAFRTMKSAMKRAAIGLYWRHVMPPHPQCVSPATLVEDAWVWVRVYGISFRHRFPGDSPKEIRFIVIEIS